MTCHRSNGITGYFDGINSLLAGNIGSNQTDSSGDIKQQQGFVNPVLSGNEYPDNFHQYGYDDQCYRKMYYKRVNIGYPVGCKHDIFF
jgi:hypothetical protein